MPQIGKRGTQKQIVLFHLVNVNEQENHSLSRIRTKLVLGRVCSFPNIWSYRYTREGIVLYCVRD